MNQLGLIMALGGTGGGDQSPLNPIMMMVFMVAIFYFILIRPQQKREKERQALLAAVKSGDRVVFSGGILGVVTNVKDKTLMIKIADNCKIEVGRGAVSRILEKGEKPEDEA